MSGWFELSKSKDAQFRFVLKTWDGGIVLVSELYTSKAAAQNGIASVQSNSPQDEHYERKTAVNGKFYQENSQGHTQEADGSVYTKEKTVTYNGQIETRQIDKFDDVFRKVSQSVAVYDHILGTITTTQTDYRTLDADGNSVVTQSVTDLNGNPVQTQSQQQDQAQAKRPFNDPFLDRYYAAIVAGDSQQVDKAALDFAQSTQGQEMAQQGQQLLTEQQAQQQQQQSAPKMVV